MPSSRAAAESEPERQTVRQMCRLRGLLMTDR